MHRTCYMSSVIDEKETTLNPTLSERMKQKQKEHFKTQLSNHRQLHYVEFTPPTTSSHNELPLNNLLLPNSLGFSGNRNELLLGNGNTIQDFSPCHVLLLSFWLF